MDMLNVLNAEFKSNRAHMRLAKYKSSKSARGPEDLMKLSVYVEENGVSMFNGLIRRCSCYTRLTVM
jgi:hypothetical protein